MLRLFQYTGSCLELSTSYTTVWPLLQGNNALPSADKPCYNYMYFIPLPHSVYTNLSMNYFMLNSAISGEGGIINLILHHLYTEAQKGRGGAGGRGPEQGRCPCKCILSFISFC